MQASSTRIQRSFQERVFHAFTFEALAIATSAPLFAWLMNVSLSTMGALALFLSTAAMLWNMVYNILFDRLQQRLLFERTLGIRILHALGFEAGLVFFTVPVAAFWLSVSWWMALKLEAGILLFFLPYTLLFNWSYDRLRQNWVAGKAATS